jgi:colanic acid/amylovoran biosynthesis glycosyltransferase
MMKIAYLMPTYPMPSQTFIRREIAALEAGGLTVHRFAARRFAGELTEAADLAEEQRTHCILSAGVWILTGAVIAVAAAHPGRWLAALGTAMSLGRRSERGVVWHLIYLVEACLLRRWLARCGARHLHVHFGTNAASVALLCRRLGGPPFSVTIHGPEEFDAPRQLALREKIHHASFVVAISQFTRSQLYRWAAAADWCKIQVIHCGLDEMFLSAVPTPIPKRPRLVNVGRLSEQKGQLLLVEAAALLHARKLDFELVIVGDGPLRGELERLIDHHGMRGQVWITGFLDNHGVRRELEAARALVMSSFAEGLPVVIMEALALGRPVISTCIAGIPELVEPGRHGWLVPAGAVEPLAAAMAAALTAETVDLETMGRAGAARVVEQHNVKNESKKLAELIAGLASIPNARTGDATCTPTMAIPGAVGSPS